MANEALSSFVCAIDSAAQMGVGKKRVRGTLTPFIDKEVRALLHERRLAIGAVRDVPAGMMYTQERARLLEVKERLRKAIKKKKSLADFQRLREIESAPGARLLWSRWRAHNMRQAVSPRSGD